MVTRRRASLVALGVLLTVISVSTSAQAKKLARAAQTAAQATCASSYPHGVGVDSKGTQDASGRTPWIDTYGAATQGCPLSIHYNGGDVATRNDVWTVDGRTKSDGTPNWPYVGPTGYSPDVDRQIYQGCKYDPNRPYGYMMGKIEIPNRGAWVFAVGNGFDSAASPYTGELYLRINDNCLDDNDGGITMNVDGTCSQSGLCAGQ